MRAHSPEEDFHEIVSTSLDGREHKQRETPGSRTLVSPRIPSSSSKNPDRTNVQTLPCRTDSRHPVSPASDGQIGRVPRRLDDGRSTVLQNHKFASSIIPIIASPIVNRDDANKHRVRSGVRLDFAHREVVVQASPDTEFAPSVTPTLACLPWWLSARWSTLCSTKLLSFLRWRLCDSNEHEETDARPHLVEKKQCS